MEFTVTPIDAETGAALRADIAAGRLAAERRVETEPGAPCRQCLCPADAGDVVYLFTYQPFRGESPYAVPSPIFLHAEPCRSHDPDAVPAFVVDGGPRTVRSYDADHRIVDGVVVPGADVATAIDALLADDRAAYVHAHCAVNGCFTFRADRRTAVLA